MLAITLGCAAAVLGLDRLAAGERPVERRAARRGRRSAPRSPSASRSARGWPLGPLADGWARRSGTPAALLATAARRRAGDCRAFERSFAGRRAAARCTQGTERGRMAVVDLRMRLRAGVRRPARARRRRPGARRRGDPCAASRSRSGRASAPGELQGRIDALAGLVAGGARAVRPAGDAVRLRIDLTLSDDAASRHGLRPPGRARRRDERLPRCSPARVRRALDAGRARRAQRTLAGLRRGERPDRRRRRRPGCAGAAAPRSRPRSSCAPWRGRRGRRALVVNGAEGEPHEREGPRAAGAGAAPRPRRRAARGRGGRRAGGRDRGQALGLGGARSRCAGALARAARRQTRAACETVPDALPRRRGVGAAAAASTAARRSRRVAPPRPYERGLATAPDARRQRRDARARGADRAPRRAAGSASSGTGDHPAPRSSRSAARSSAPASTRSPSARRSSERDRPARAVRRAACARVLVGGYYGAWLRTRPSRQRASTTRRCARMAPRSARASSSRCPPTRVPSPRSRASCAGWPARTRGSAGRACTASTRSRARVAVARGGHRRRERHRPARALVRPGGGPRRVPPPRRRRALPAQRARPSSPTSSRTTAVTVPAPRAHRPPVLAVPDTGAGWPHEAAADRRPDRVQRPRRMRGAVPRVDPARRLGLPDARRRAGSRRPAPPRPPRRGGLPDARAASARPARRAGVTAPRSARRAGTAGNELLTSATGAVLTALLLAEGVTILWLGGLRTEHMFIGLVLIPPVAAQARRAPATGSSATTRARRATARRARRCSRCACSPRSSSRATVLVFAIRRRAAAHRSPVRRRCSSCTRSPSSCGAPASPCTSSGTCRAPGARSHAPGAARASTRAPGSRLRGCSSSASLGGGLALALALLSPDREPGTEARRLGTVVPVRVLIVDDDRALRDALRRALTLAGYEVDTAAERRGRAWRASPSGRPDAVVLDVGHAGAGRARAVPPAARRAATASRC